MSVITTLDDLRTRYRTATGRAVQKVLGRLEKNARHFISLSPFLIIGSSSDEGPADVSPRGESPGFVHVLDETHIAIPDRPGNNRLDTFENILRNPDVALIFLIPGVDETLRINGKAEIRDDESLLERFEVNGKRPVTVLVVTVEAVYLHCAKALMRSALWLPETLVDRRELPTMGQMINEQIGENRATAETQEAMAERYRNVLY
jgi:PPOX class probable FMN-dependent enzyme